MKDAVDLAMEVMQAAFDPQWGEAWNRRQLCDSLAMPNVHLTVIDASGAITEEAAEAGGFALVRVAPGEEELLLIAVTPACRRRGLGRILLAHVIQQAIARGSEKVFLEMRHNNPAAALYEAQGFRPMGRRKGYYRLSNGERIDAITFGLSV